jgi:two-component system, NarL family, nitrate/nitrite response regulator NarL
MPRACRLTRITIVEDHELFAEALDVALTIEGHQVHRVPFSQHTWPQGNPFDAILRSRPQVVLLDLNLGSATNGAHVVQPLTAVGIAVVVVTGSTDRARWGEVLALGARTVLPKSAPLNTILATIRMIEEGRRVLPREERDRLLACYQEQRGEAMDRRARLESLTMREREILDHLTDGMQVRDIAHESFVSEATVRTQVKSILAKLGVSSQLAAVCLVLKAHRRQPAHNQHS